MTAPKHIRVGPSFRAIKARDPAEWLQGQPPGPLEEDRHSREGAVERAYWRLGYLSALAETLGWSPEVNN